MTDGQRQVHESITADREALQRADDAEAEVKRLNEKIEYLRGIIADLRKQPRTKLESLAVRDYARLKMTD